MDILQFRHKTCSACFNILAPWLNGAYHVLSTYTKVQSWFIIFGSIDWSTQKFSPKRRSQIRAWFAGPKLRLQTASVALSRQRLVLGCCPAQVCELEFHQLQKSLATFHFPHFWSLLSGTVVRQVEWLEIEARRREEGSPRGEESGEECSPQTCPFAEGQPCSLHLLRAGCMDAWIQRYMDVWLRGCKDAYKSVLLQAAKGCVQDPEGGPRNGVQILKSTCPLFFVKFILNRMLVSRFVVLIAKGEDLAEG